jgi:threonine dehydratase
MRKHIDGCIDVPENDLIELIKYFAERCKMIVEPTGLLELAGLKKLIKQGEIKDGAKVGIVLSGGNIDFNKFSKLITEHEQA